MGRKQKLKEQRKKEEKKTASFSAGLPAERGTLYYIIYMGLIILLFYPPYFRGMFFDKEFLPTHIYTGLLFMTWMIYKGFIKKEQDILKAPVDYAALALVAAYFISIFAAVNIRYAVGELLKYINYFMAFYLVSDFARTEKDIRIILWTMVLSAFGVAFVGIGAAARTIAYNGAFVDGMINSTLQYHNTLAAYLTGAFMICAALWVVSEKHWQRAILACINYTLFLAFLFSLSRGAWLMFPLFFIILLAGIPGKYRRKIFGNSVETFISAIAVSPAFGAAISAQQKTAAWSWYIAGLALAIILYYAVEKTSERFALHIKPKVIISAIIVFIILLGSICYIVFTTDSPVSHMASRFLPQNIGQRLSSIQMGDHSVQERLTFYRDALQIIKKHPLIGTGGGGWKAMYSAFQSYRYFSTEVHNFFLQVWTETGTLGFLILIALWFIVFRTEYNIIKSDSDTAIRALSWGALAGAIALGGHSMMDFNLSLGAVSLFLWEIFGIIKAASIISAPKALSRSTSNVFHWPCVVASVVFILISFSLYQGYVYGQQAVSYVQQQDVARAREAFEKASKYDPLTSSFKADLSQIEEAIGRQTKDEKLIQKAEEDKITAVNLDPYNAKLRVQMAAYYLNKGKLSEGIAELERASELNPFNADIWENLADAYEKVAELYIRQGKKDDVLNLTKKSISIFDKITQINMKAPKNAPQKLDMTNRLMLYIYKSKLLAEHIDDKNYYKKLDSLVFASDFTIDTDKNGIPDLWQITNSQGNVLKIKVEKDYARITSSGEEPAFLSSTENISLKANTFYTINVDIKGNISKGKVTLNILTQEGTNPQYQAGDIAPDTGNAPISKTFRTTKDLKEGKQSIRFDIRGSDNEYLDIKYLEIWQE